MLSVIIPACNEEDYIGPTLEALLRQTDRGPAEILVAANACTDRTVVVARGFVARFLERGWDLQVLDIVEGGKPNALNRGDAAASGDMRLYMDADVIVGPRLLEQLRNVLQSPEPTYASGRFCITPPESWVTRHYVALWTKLPFMTTGVPGGGLWAVNAGGRARWGEYPAITADDSFARLQFVPSERIGVPEIYTTPLAEGFWPLARIRRRWEAGTRELAETYPELLKNDDKVSLGWSGHLRLFTRMPVSYLVYVVVRMAARIGRSAETGWLRGR